MAAASLGMLAFGILYLQNHLGLEPCPMCIVQRYALIGVTVWCVLGASANAPKRSVLMSWLVLLTAGFGAFVAARQTWLQWYPPEVVSCGRDFYGMIENFPLQRAVPMIFKGSGDCTKIDWTFLGGLNCHLVIPCFHRHLCLDACAALARRLVSCRTNISAP